MPQSFDKTKTWVKKKKKKEKNMQYITKRTYYIYLYKNVHKNKPP